MYDFIFVVLTIFSGGRYIKTIST